MTLSAPIGLASLRRRVPRRAAQSASYLTLTTLSTFMLLVCVLPSAVAWECAGAALTLAVSLLLVPRSERGYPLRPGGLLERRTVGLLLVLAALSPLLYQPAMLLPPAALAALSVLDPLYRALRTRAARPKIAAAGFDRPLSQEDVDPRPQAPLDSDHPGPFPDSDYAAGVPGARSTWRSACSGH